jgi:hypothetical protein
MVLVTTFSPENAHCLQLVPAKQGPAPAIMYQTAELKMDTWSEIGKRIEGGTTGQEFESPGNLALSHFLMSVSHFLTTQKERFHTEFIPVDQAPGRASGSFQRLYSHPLTAIAMPWLGCLCPLLPEKPDQLDCLKINDVSIQHVIQVPRRMVW